MNVSRRFTPAGKKVLLAGLAMLAITACQDVVSAPQSRLAAALPSFVRSTNGTTKTFTYDPAKGANAQIGKVGIYFEAGQVCDPATSNYGPAYWDAPCQPLTTKMSITATVYTNTSNLPYVEFSPALRFQRSAKGHLPALYVSDTTAANNPLTRILYCNDGGGCFDESKSDTALVVGHYQGYLYRQLKHFSGYNVAAGYTDSSSTSVTTTLGY